MRSVCQSKTQQNAGGQGNYNKQPRNAKGQQVKQRGYNKQPGIQSGGTNVKDEPKTEESNPTHQQALDYWKMAHQVKEMGGTSITIPTEGRQATFAEVLKFGQDHSNWKEGDPILWKASDLIRTQNLAMGGLTIRDNRREETSSEGSDTEDSDDWTVVHRKNRRNSGAKGTTQAKEHNNHQERSKRHRQQTRHEQPNS